MEGVWIVVGGAVTAISGFIAWFLNSQTTEKTQSRRQNHELRMLEQRLEAERLARHEEATREERKARLRPVFDAMDQVSDVLLIISAQLVPKKDEETKTRYNKMYDEADVPEKLLRLAGRAKRIPNETLRREVTEMSLKAFGATREEQVWLDDQLPHIYERLGELQVLGVDQRREWQG